MKTIEISKGGTTAVKIELHDPELSVVVHDAVAEDVKELPVRRLYKGQRVRNLREIHHVKKGANGTVDEDSVLPWVIWDSPEMLTDAGRRRENLRWVQDSCFLEVIEEVKEEVKELPVRMLYKGQRVRNLQEDDSHVKKGATGTVDDDHDLPYVIWDSPEMLTDLGQREDRRWAHFPCFLEVIEEVKQLPYLSNPSDTNPDEPREVKVPFDASRMAEAVRFETRAGQEVKCVVANDVEAEYPVTGYLNGWLTWTNDGRFSTTGAQRPLDLFMVVQEVRND